MAVNMACCKDVNCVWKPVHIKNGVQKPMVQTYTERLFPTQFSTPGVVHSQGASEFERAVFLSNNPLPALGFPQESFR